MCFTTLIREKGGGDFQGQPRGNWQIHARKHGIPLDQFRPANGESLQDLYCRVRVFFEHLKIVSELAQEAPSRPRILVVTHSGWIRMFYKMCCEFHPGREAWPVPQNCRLHQFALTAESRLVHLKSNVAASELSCK